MHKKRNSGVTLVELAIVIVIIGILVIGVLQGNTLILEAKISSDIAKLDSFRSRSETFRLKYGQLPGDFSHATRIWPDCTSINTSRFSCDGDGNGLWDNRPYDEGSMAYYHLFRADLGPDPHIDSAQPLNLTVFLLKSTGQLLTVQAFASSIPGAMDGGFFYNYPNRVNTFWTLNYPTDGNGTNIAEEKFQTASVLHEIDAKIDDGNASTGFMRTVYDPTETVFPIADVCADSSGNYKINQTDTCIGWMAIKY